MSRVSKHLAGLGIVFEVDGVEFALRAPSSNERDEAAKVEAVAKRFAFIGESEEAKQLRELAKHPAPDDEIDFYNEIVKHEEEQLRAESVEEEQEALERRINFMYTGVKTRTAADTPAEDIARVKRGRYLARVLLIDADGKKVDINEQSITLQDKARDVAGRLWSDLSELPFLSEQFSKAK